MRDKAQQRRRHRERVAASLPSGVYTVIYADPPWRFETWSEKGLDRSADNHYATMALSDIVALRIPAARNAVLFLWATAPMLPAALSVMTAWGFSYRSFLAWDKRASGTGYWVRSRAELLLIGAKGRMRAPTPGVRFPGIVFSTRTRHSEKPELVAQLIERAYPDAAKLELFARRERPGWTVWGNEVDPTKVDATM